MSWSELSKICYLALDSPLVPYVLSCNISPKVEIRG